MTHVKLPTGYEDWVEVPHPISSLPQRPEHGRFLEVVWGIGDATRTGTSVVWKPGNTRYFVPPKPKPVLPDVKPGAVLSYRDKQGRRVRAVYPSSRLWDVYHQPHTPLNTACHMMVMSESQILADVDADGFTVEMDGL